MSHEESQAQLSKKLVDAALDVTVGGRYMHYKQLSYEVLAVALLEATNEPCVVYQAEYGDNLTWVRPLSSWVEEITVNGKKVTRFTQITDTNT